MRVAADKTRLFRESGHTGCERQQEECESDQKTNRQAHRKILFLVSCRVLMTTSSNGSLPVGQSADEPKGADPVVWMQVLQNISKPRRLGKNRSGEIQGVSGPRQR